MAIPILDGNFCDFFYLVEVFLDRILVFVLLPVLNLSHLTATSSSQILQPVGKKFPSGANSYEILTVSSSLDGGAPGVK